MAQCNYFISLNNAFFTEQEGEECQLIQEADSVANLGAVAGGGDDDDDQKGCTSRVRTKLRGRNRPRANEGEEDPSLSGKSSDRKPGSAG